VTAAGLVVGTAPGGPAGVDLRGEEELAAGDAGNYARGGPAWASLPGPCGSESPGFPPGRAGRVATGRPDCSTVLRNLGPARSDAGREGSQGAWLPKIGQSQILQLGESDRCRIC